MMVKGKPAKPVCKKRYNVAVKRASQALENQRLLCQVLQLQRDLAVAREQVLVDAILQLEDHAVFRESIEQHEQQQELGEQQDQQQKQPQHPQPVHYSARLLHNMQPAVAQDILSWGVDEWHTCFTTTASEISIMLHVLARDVGKPALHEPPGPAATGMEHLGNQRIVQVVDKLAAAGLVGSIFGDRVGQQLGTVTATNHLSMQLEAPPPEHWRQVLLQLQPTYPQLCQLAAGFLEFARLRKNHQAMQLALTDHVECHVSCNPQTLVATGKDGSSAPTGEAAGGSTAAAGSGGCGAVAAASEGGCAAATAAAAEGPPAPACSSLMDQLLRSLNHAFIMVQALMLNTLTNRQIAVLVVSSFPYVPRPAPLMEAAYELLTSQHGGVTPAGNQGPATPSATDSGGAAGVAPAAAAAEPAGAGPAMAAAATMLDGVYRDQIDAHMQQRIQQLQQHVQRWWQFELPSSFCCK